MSSFSRDPVRCTDCPSVSAFGVGTRGTDNFRYHIRTRHAGSDAASMRRRERAARSLVSLSGLSGQAQCPPRWKVFVS